MDWQRYSNPSLVRSARLLFIELPPSEYKEFVHTLRRGGLKAMPTSVADDTNTMKVETARPLRYGTLKQKVDGAWSAAFRHQAGDMDLVTPTIIDTSVSPWKDR